MPRSTPTSPPKPTAPPRREESPGLCATCGKQRRVDCDGRGWIEGYAGIGSCPND